MKTWLCILCGIVWHGDARFWKGCTVCFHKKEDAA